MPTPFPRTLRSLGADRYTRPIAAAAVAALLLGGWIAWLVAARVPLFEVSSSARLVLERSVHALEAPETGRIERYDLRLGESVALGQTLVVLDSSEPSSLLDEERARLAALASETEALAAKIAAREQARSESQRSAEQSLRQAEVELHGLELSAELAAEELSRLERLKAQGGVSEFDISRARLAAERERATLEANKIALLRLDLDHALQDGEREAAIADLEREKRRLAGEIAARTASARRLESALARYTLCAPVAGQVGEIGELGPGSEVARGRRLGALVSPGVLAVVAEFPPAAALGRIRVGQRARVALAGFPATEYGTLDAVVASVASEAPQGFVRVELALADVQDARVPLEHGLPGVVEVEVETVSPAELVLRSAGKRAARSAAAPPPGSVGNVGAAQPASGGASGVPRGAG